MGMTRLLTIGVIALGTLGQTGWGQEGNGRVEALTKQLEQARQENQRLRVELAERGLVVNEDTSGATPLIDIKFKGGDVKALVAALKDKQPRANILLEPQAAGIAVPAFEAFGVTPAGAIEIARNILSDPRDLEVSRVQLNGDDSSPAISVRMGRTLRAAIERKQYAAQASMPLNTPTKAWNLKNWMSGNEEAVTRALAAIEVGLESYDSRMILKYHEPSGVLMARGYEQQIDLVDSIIREAAGSAEPGMTRKDLTAQLRGAESNLATLEDELHVLQIRQAASAVAVREARELKASPSTIANAEVQVAQVQAMLNQHERKIQYAIEQRDALQAKIAAMNDPALKAP